MKVRFFEKKNIIRIKKSLSFWIASHYLHLSIYNSLLLLLVLLRSAGYFAPFFSITINLIVLVALLASIVMLGARSRTMIVVTIFFWSFAALLKVVKIDVWAERTAIYAFEAFLVGVVIYLFENFAIINKTKRKKTND